MIGIFVIVKNVHIFIFFFKIEIQLMIVSVTKSKQKIKFSVTLLEKKIFRFELPQSIGFQIPTQLN